MSQKTLQLNLLLLFLFNCSCQGKLQEIERINSELEKQIVFKNKNINTLEKLVNNLKDSIIILKNNNIKFHSLMEDSLYALINEKDSLHSIITGDSKRYDELHSFLNITNLQSQLGINNILAGRMQNPKSRIVIPIKYSNYISSVLIFAITGEDRIREVKKKINNAAEYATKNGASVLAKDRKIKAIFEVLHNANFFNDIKLLDTETNKDRNINIFVATKEVAQRWEYDPSTLYEFISKYPNKSVCNEKIEALISQIMNSICV